MKSKDSDHHKEGSEEKEYRKKAESVVKIRIGNPAVGLPRKVESKKSEYYSIHHRTTAVSQDWLE
jgi:hypothetical protein